MVLSFILKKYLCPIFLQGKIMEIQYKIMEIQYKIQEFGPDVNENI